MVISAPPAAAPIDALTVAPAPCAAPCAPRTACDKDGGGDR